MLCVCVCAVCIYVVRVCVCAVCMYVVSVCVCVRRGSVLFRTIFSRCLHVVTPGQQFTRLKNKNNYS